MQDIWDATRPNVYSNKKKYSKKNFPGYLLYQQVENPKQSADLVIDANNWEQLVIKSMKSK